MNGAYFDDICVGLIYSRHEGGSGFQQGVKSSSSSSSTSPSSSSSSSSSSSKGRMQDFLKGGVQLRSIRRKRGVHVVLWAQCYIVGQGGSPDPSTCLSYSGPIFYPRALNRISPMAILPRLYIHIIYNV